MIEVVVIETPSLGDRSYLATDGITALVVDPQRDIERVLAVAAERGVEITDVFETHIHNDYVTGGLALASRTGAAYHLNAADPVAFGRAGITHGDLLTAGSSMQVRVIATPGHTFTHLAYALADARTGEVAAVFTGGCLLYGTTGRPDLLGAANTPVLAAGQYDSARRLALALPDETPVFPTHGFGSFCAATTAAAHRAATTIGDEKRSNPALVLDRDTFVAQLLAGLDAYPAYYAHMAALNRAGPAAPRLCEPAPARAQQLQSRVGAGEWAADLRPRRDFAAGHLPGTLSFEYGNSFATYLGWLLPWGTPLTLIGETSEQIAAAQRDLARIGIDQLAGAVVAGSGGWPARPGLSAYPVSDFAGLAAAQQREHVTILDVRRAGERAGGCLQGSVHIPLHELPARLPGLPPGPVWVHCQAGYRACIAASLLDAGGYQVTAVDDDFSRAAAAGLAITRGPGPDQPPSSIGAATSEPYSVQEPS